MKTKALVFSNEKEAILFFDKIYPMSLLTIIIKNKESARIILENILPREVISGIHELHQTLKYLSNNPISLFEYPYTPNEFLVLGMHSEYINNNDTLFNVDQYIKDEMKEISMFYEEWIKSLNDYAIVGGNLTPENGNDFCFSLENLQLIDTTSISWEQILEIKKDKNLLKKFRNFRLFFENELKTKKWDKNEAKETFMKMQEDYESAIKSMRFNAITGTIHTIISKESLISSLVGSIIGGNVTNNTIGSLIGTSIPLIGNIVLNTIKTTYNNKKILDQEPIAYIYETKKHLGKKIEL